MRMSSAPSLEHRAENSRDLVKIDFPVDDEVAREYGEYETMWARSLGDARYELRNVPIWVFDLSLGDEIFAKPNLDGDNLLFSGIAARGGHSTYRIRIRREALAHGIGRHGDRSKSSGAARNAGRRRCVRSMSRPRRISTASTRCSSKECAAAYGSSMNFTSGTR